MGPTFAKNARPEKNYGCIFEGRRFQGRPMNNWEDVIRKDPNQLLGTRNWMEDRRENWRRKLGESRVRFGP